MGILLAPISLILFCIIFFIETIFSFFFKTKNRKWFSLVSDRMYKKAKLIDIFGNYLFPEFWEWFFSNKKEPLHRFGRLGETISSVLGKKYLDKNLNFFGFLIYYILYIIDIPSWKYNGHCIRWIMSDDEIDNFKK